jgi:2,3-dihydroxy-p-cumate/2,3-dihydroxybenzoate 3,4-dioxygenase
MIELQQIRYVRLGTRDLEATCTYAKSILGLQEIRRENGCVYYRSDNRDHTIVYFEGDPSDNTVSFELTTSEELDSAAAALEMLKHPVREGTKDECDTRHVRRFITFKDPSGNSFELVYRPDHSGWRYFPTRDAGITGFSHIGLRSTNPPRDEKFWTSVFNARVSDWIGDCPLLRIDEVHHTIAIFPSDRPGVQHINHQVESIDDVMRSFYFLTERQVKIVFGPGRHPTSSAMFLYFEGPDGMVYEYSTGVRKIADEATYRPRSFPAGPQSFCMWGAKPDIPEFK